MLFAFSGLSSAFLVSWRFALSFAKWSTQGANVDFSDYQAQAHTTAVYPAEDAVTYTTLGLVGEAGEIANKVKKAIRDDGGAMSDERRAAILDELGDVLWYAAELCTALGAELGEVAAANVAKLRSRQARARFTATGIGGKSGDWLCGQMVFGLNHPPPTMNHSL